MSESILAAQTSVEAIGSSIPVAMCAHRGTCIHTQLCAYTYIYTYIYIYIDTDADRHAYVQSYSQDGPCVSKPCLVEDWFVVGVAC